MEARDQLPQEVRLSQDRDTIASLIDNWRFDEIPKAFPDIKIVERAENRKGEDCAVYAFGKGKFYPDEIQTVIETGVEVDEYKQGDIIIYYDDDGNYTHIGKGAEDGRVVSKWGTAHVYEHPKMLVPIYYGDPKGYRVEQTTE